MLSEGSAHSSKGEVGELVVAQGGGRAVVRGAEFDALLLLLAVAAGGEHLLAGERQLDGAPHMPCGHGRQGDVRPDHGFAAESPADVRGTDPYLRRRDAQQRRHGALASHDPLGGVVESEPVAVPDRCGGRGLDGVVVVRCEMVRRVEPVGRRLETGLNITAHAACRDEPREDRLGFIGLVPALVQGGDGGAPLVVDVHLPGRELGAFVRVRDHHGHRLSEVVDDVAL